MNTAGRVGPQESVHGFTLMELMIVVAIIGILAAIAYPSYRESVDRGRRSDAQGGLVGLAARLEREFVDNNSYANAAGGATLPAAPANYPASVPQDGRAATYNLRITALTARTFTIAAIPTGTQTGDRCGTFTLTNTGARGLTGQASGLTVDDCWR